jgi:hypothetical protein
MFAGSTGLDGGPAIAQAADHMMLGIANPRLPLWAVFAVAVVVVLLSILVGYVLGTRAGRKGSQPIGPIGSASGAMVGLLAFILALTFSIASSRFDTRKQLVLNEVTTLATAVRRADLLPEPQRARSLVLLRRMVDLQVEAVRDERKIPHVILENEAIEDTLWAIAAPLARTALNSATGSLYLQSLNAVEETRTRRIAIALQFRIPANIWIGLILVTVFSMAGLGFQFGVAGRGSVIIMAGLALAFASVVLLIAQLDRTREGGIEVNQQPFFDLQHKLSVSAH